MRGAVLAPGGKTILALPSTAGDDEYSRILPLLQEGAGVTLNRGDVHYVVTEYGIAYLHGKNIRERAMELIAIAHPKFRAWLIEEAKKDNLIYEDQMFIPGKAGEYPEELELYRTTRSGLDILIRPVKISRRAAAQGLLLLASRTRACTAGSSPRGRTCPTTACRSSWSSTTPGRWSCWRWCRRATRRFPWAWASTASTRAPTPPRSPSWSGTTTRTTASARSCSPT